jgi:hypothetical protein
MPFTKWRATFADPLYDSGVLTGNGNSGRIPVPGVVNGGSAIIPVFLTVVGTGLATDETATVTVNWFPDASAHLAVGTTTFDAMTAGSPQDTEVWPGDVSSIYSSTDELCPLLPYMQVNWTLAGTTISLSFVFYQHYLRLDG